MWDIGVSHYVSSVKRTASCALCNVKRGAFCYIQACEIITGAERRHFNVEFHRNFFDVPSTSTNEQMDFDRRGLKSYIKRDKCTDDYVSFTDVICSADIIEAAHHSIPYRSHNSKLSQAAVPPRSQEATTLCRCSLETLGSKNYRKSSEENVSQKDFVCSVMRTVLILRTVQKTQITR